MSSDEEPFWSKYAKEHPQVGEDEAPNYRTTKNLLKSCRNCRSFDWDGMCTKHMFYSQGYTAGDASDKYHVCDSFNR